MRTGIETELSHLFFYFDNLEDLAPDSAFRKRIAKEGDMKREEATKYMTYQIE